MNNQRTLQMEIIKFTRYSFIINIKHQDPLGLKMVFFVIYMSVDLYLFIFIIYLTVSKVYFTQSIICDRISGKILFIILYIV